MAKRTAGETWKLLEEGPSDEEIDDHLAAVLAMTPEEQRRELELAGFDLDAVRAHALAAVPARLPLATPVRTPGSTRRRLFVAVPAALALAAGAAIVLHHPREVVSLAPPDDDAVSRATTLRQSARAACDDRQWEGCLAKLNDARTLDPSGDAAPDVQALRQKAWDALRAAP